MAQSVEVETTVEAAAEITITVKLFAAYQEAYGLSELQLCLPAGAAVSAVRDRLIADKPELERWRNITGFGINLEWITDPATALKNGDEVVLIPPVSGG